MRSWDGLCTLAQDPSSRVQLTKLEDSSFSLGSSKFDGKSLGDFAPHHCLDHFVRSGDLYTRWMRGLGDLAEIVGLPKIIAATGLRWLQGALSGEVEIKRDLASQGLCLSLVAE